MGHQNVFKAKNVESRNCGEIGHYARINRIERAETKKKNSPHRKINTIRVQSPMSSSENESTEDSEVLHIDGDVQKNKHFVLKGKFNKIQFHPLVDTWSPITILTKAGAGKMFAKQFRMQLFDRKEKYVECSSNKIEFLGAIIGQVDTRAISWIKGAH